MFQISKNDILALSPPLPAPAVLTPHRPLFTHFIHSSHALTHLVTSLISARLPLKSSIRDAGGLPSLHRLSAHSGDQIRFVKAHPRRTTDPRTAALGEHTDFGSVTVLFNRLGGLQVRLPPSISIVPPEEEEVPASEAEMAMCADGWAYVRPLEGCCVVNLGDALVKFSKGGVRSNLHRVVDPPGKQSGVERFSLVYFARPEDEVRLRGLVEGEGEDEGNDEVVTAKEWILRRALGRREKDGWERSQGTEDGR
jgi:isopenicillin N synthase-like dioxygenase